jgi:N-acetylglucosamine kinase-like BadF-type ATPase
MNTILIADSGSTKTHWRLLAAGAAHDYHTQGINPYYQSEESILQTLRQELLPQIGDRNLDEIYFYGAGCSLPDKQSIVNQALQSIWPNSQLTISHDMLAAARATCLREAGIACILGTGANTCYYDGQDIALQVENFGFWLGDEGSGGHIGKVLLQAFLHRQMPEPLQKAFAEAFPALDTAYILEKAYRQPFPNRFFASFAPFIVQHLEIPFCRNLVAQSFRDFLCLYVTQIPQHHCLPIHFVGSVASVFEAILQEVLAEAKMKAGFIFKSPMERLTLYHQTQN